MTTPTLTKLTVNLLPEAVKAMEIASIRSGRSRTDTLNKALVMFEMATRPVSAGMTAEITDADDPSLRLLKVSTERIGLVAWLKLAFKHLFGGVR
jgi:hypothetical protein